MNQVFENRKEAGILLSAHLSLLSKKEQENAIILALPRGGVPVAYEISQKTRIPFDVLIVRKIGHPLQPEYGIGAITEDGFYWMDPEAVGLSEVTKNQIDQVIKNEKKEIKRRVDIYRSGRTLPALDGKTVILVDDGLATGVTARVGAQFAKAKGAAKVILAIPVCSERTAERLRNQVDQVICLNEPNLFFGVGQFYRDFTQLSDEDVLKFLPSSQKSASMADIIAEDAKPLKNRNDLTSLIEKLSESKIVMLGESSHGTQEFYEWRRLISQELISRHGFNFIAVEGDWPPSAELNRFIHFKKKNETARMALRHFQRWPTWMWANTEIMELAQWMKKYNEEKTKTEKASFFGLDVYSLFESIDEVLKVLQKIDPVLARQAQIQYECFDLFQRDEKAYARYLSHFPEGCENEVLNVLNNLLKTRLGEIQTQTEDLFDAQQNARIVKNAENYYRAMIHGDENSWNIRDRHMIETLEILLQKFGPKSKAIVWAHNTHIGDYRATNMVHEGQINIGGLAREKWGDDKVSLVGFGTYQGEVIASHAWDGPIETMTVPPGKADSYEHHFHQASAQLKQNSFYLWLKGESKLNDLKQVLGHRAIGVVYHPAYERFGNYVPTSLSNRYDGFIFIDKTKALTPLAQKFIREEIPETWPTGV